MAVTVSHLIIPEETQSKAQEMWAFWNAKTQQFECVWATKLQVQLCFPDGGKYAEETGEGKIMEVLVTPVRKKDKDGDR